LLIKFQSIRFVVEDTNAILFVQTSTLLASIMIMTVPAKQRRTAREEKREEERETHTECGCTS